MNPVVKNFSAMCESKSPHDMLRLVTYAGCPRDIKHVRGIAYRNVGTDVVNEARQIRCHSSH
jgi:hypothetical protein